MKLILVVVMIAVGTAAVVTTRTVMMEAVTTFDNAMKGATR